MTSPSGFSEYSVTWMCNECGERWADLDKPNDPCTATEGCTGEAMGLAFYEGPASGPNPVPFTYVVTHADGTQTRYNSDGTVAE